MGWFGPSGNCGCCGGCPPVLCNDGVTYKRLVTRTLELSFPDTLIFILDAGTTRDVRISTGWAAISGTYTWEINPDTCVFPGTNFEGADIVEERRSYSNFGGLATCANYQSLTPLSITYTNLNKSDVRVGFGSLVINGYLGPGSIPFYRMSFDPPPLPPGAWCEETELTVNVLLATTGEFCSFPGATAVATYYE